MKFKVGLELLQAILLEFQNSHQGDYSTISPLIGCLREITFLIAFDLFGSAYLFVILLVIQSHVAIEYVIYLV